MPSVANRLQNLPPYVFAVIGERIREMQANGADVIRLDIGSPDMPPPNVVSEALSDRARHPGVHGYCGYRGTADFRQAIARYYSGRFGVELDPEREVLPLIGSKEGIVNLSLAYLDAGDVALVPDIGYPSYAQGARLAGADVYWLPMMEETGFVPDLHSIPADVLRRAKLLWLNYPNNPTGAVVDVEFYAQVVEFCRVNDLLLASDNPYVDITFDGYRAPSLLQVPGAKLCSVEFVSFSKTYNMAGWRLGAAVGSPGALSALLNVKSNLDSGHFRPVYDAGIVAVDQTSQEWIDQRNLVYQRRRDLVLSGLADIGLRAQTPRGTLYIWARADGMRGADYVDEALRMACVSLAPGGEYGPGGEQYVRFSLCAPDQRLSEALARLKTWYSSR